MSQTDKFDYFLFGSLFTLFFISCVIAPASTILYSYDIVFFGNYITFWQVLFSWFVLCIISIVFIWNVRTLNISIPVFIKSLLSGGDV